VMGLQYLYLEHELLRPPDISDVTKMSNVGYGLGLVTRPDLTYSFNPSHLLSFLLFISLGHTSRFVQVPNKPLLGPYVSQTRLMLSP